MAATHGHGNPNWTREEVIMALDLFFDGNGAIPGPNDSKVIALSNLLRAFPHHNIAARKESFRNPDGVAFKLQNIRKVVTGKGLGNVSKMDREVCEELANDPIRTRQIAELIRSGVEVSAEIPDEVNEDELFNEGRVVTETHLRRERVPKLRKLLITQRRAAEKMYCDICGCESQSKDETIGNSIFEAHHLLPLSAGKERTTQIRDLALLCANCHKMVHKAISKSKLWLTLDQARTWIFG